VVKVPYCLRVTEERLIYEKLLRESELADSPCAPEVLEMLSRFSVSTRLSEFENSPLYTKMRVYDGENLKEHRSQGQGHPGVPRRRGGRRGHDRRQYALRLQDPVADLQL
jgi:predicted Ser/Thr protein kinase